jgi:copper chaperone CopZ
MKAPTMTIELTLKDMSCGHCAKAVTDAVRQIDPGADVKVDLVTKRVQIESSADIETLKRALAEEGYPAS